jgi:hypothetical protein
MLQVEVGKAADGFPQVEMSMVELEVACLMTAGTFARYVTHQAP